MKTMTYNECKTASKERGLFIVAQSSVEAAQKWALEMAKLVEEFSLEPDVDPADPVCYYRALEEARSERDAFAFDAEIAAWHASSPYRDGRCVVAVGE